MLSWSLKALEDQTIDTRVMLMKVFLRSMFVCKNQQRDFLDLISSRFLLFGDLLFFLLSD